MRTELILRFGLWAHNSWVRKRDYGIKRSIGPNADRVPNGGPAGQQDFTTVAEFTIGEGQSETFRLTGYPSHEAEPAIRTRSACYRSSKSDGANGPPLLL